MMTLKLLRYLLHDQVRSRWFLVYVLFFFLVSDALLRFGGTDIQAVLSLVGVAMLILPIISLILGAMLLYNSREFITLLLSQPIPRRSLYWALYFGLCIPLTAGYALGTSLPFLIHFSDAFWQLLPLLGSGILLIHVFSALAFLTATLIQDRAAGLAASVLIWFFLTVIYDGLILVVVFQFSSYPLEGLVLAASLCNPIDLARLLVLLQLDVSTLMGLTGAVFHRFFAGSEGRILAAAALLVWIAAPLAAAGRLFSSRDW